MEIVELALMRGLLARGHRVHALVSGWNDGDFVERLTAAGIPYTAVFTGKITLSRPDWMLDTVRHLPGARRAVRRLVRDLAPDLVVACNRDALVLLTGVFGRAPVVYHAHEALSNGWATFLARLAGGFFAVSAYVGERLAGAGVSRERIDVVLNGVERAPYAPNRTPASPPTLGICGQVGPWKGHDDLVEALGIVAARDVPFRLRIYGTGDPSYVDALKARIDRLGFTAAVEWMGFESRPDRMYASLDVVVAPSRIEESFGMTLAEAGARGLPVVAAQIGGMPEVVVAGETGLLVPRRDPARLADALAALLTQPDTRRRMGEAARARVDAHFLTEKMVERFEAAARRIVAQSGTSAPGAALPANGHAPSTPEALAR